MLRLPLLAALALATLPACGGIGKYDETGVSDDLDGDGYGADSDCDDTNAEIHPDRGDGCDGIDEDCDGQTDEDGVDEWFADTDGDDHGDASAPVVACEPPEGYVSLGDDCNDDEGSIHPGATEVCNGLDDDCDGTPDDGATGADTWYPDVDHDGHGDAAGAVDACESLDGYVSVGDDCDDDHATAYPGATEVCDGIDNDCDTEVDEPDPETSPLWYYDGDGDNYGDPDVSTYGCTPPEGYVGDDSDCDDRYDTVYPGAPELCDDLDNNCDGAVDSPLPSDATTWYADADGDGYGDRSSTTVACDQPRGYVADTTDCNDRSRSVNPAAAEVCNGIDDNCDGSVDPGCGGDTGGDTAVDTGGDTGGGTVGGECDGVNTADVASDITSMGGPNLLFAMVFTPTTDMDLGRIEVWTGEQSGTNSVSVWSNDSARYQPSASLASGSWTMSSTNSWQGADLDTCVTLTAGTTYWIVWAPINGAQANIDTAGTTVDYRGSFDGGASWNGPYSGYTKYKLFCCE